MTMTMTMTMTMPMAMAMAMTGSMTGLRGTSSQAPCPGLGPAEERANDALVGRALRISWMCSARLAHVCVFTVASVFL